MPRPNAVCRGAVANQYRVHCSTEIALDKRCRFGFGADEIAQQSDDVALTEALALPQQPRSSRREPDALALELLECPEFALERRVLLYSAPPGRPCR